MQVVKANILSPQVLRQADAVCITTNGIVKNNGCAVMGAGVAKAFRDTLPGIDQLLGKLLREHGNITQIITSTGDLSIVAFPTKNHWRDKSDINLIKASALQLVDLANRHEWKSVWLPRPGCNNGGLDWNTVGPFLRGCLDNRFTICHL